MLKDSVLEKCALAALLFAVACSDNGETDSGTGGVAPVTGGTAPTGGALPGTGGAAPTGGALPGTGGAAPAMGGAAPTTGGVGPGTGGVDPSGGSGGGPPPVTGPQDFDTNVPIGWAVVPGYGLQSTTGGGGGEVVTVSSHGDLASAVSGEVPRIVLVQGMMSGGDIVVGSNKTIIGVGADAGLSGCYLNMNPAQNVIIRNLSISGGTDAIAARHTTQLWIDHMDVSKCGDGLIDLTRETDHYTVSWVRFSNHHKTMLLNGGSTHREDKGKINGTVHHCFFDGSNTRNPRAGFGMIHIFNDYNLDNGYAIGFHTDSKVVAERNYFENTDEAIRQMYDEGGHPAWELGDALAVDNHFENASGDESTGIGFTVTDYYMYDFALDDVMAVPEIVRAGAGTKAELGEIGLMPIPGQGAIKVDYSTLSWKTGTASPESYVVYFGTDTNPPEVSTTTETSYEAGPLASGTQYYWRVDQVVSGTAVTGKLWTFKAL